MQVAEDYGANLHVLCVVPRLGQYAANMFPASFAAKNADAERARLGEIGAKIDLPQDHLHLHVANGAVYDKIIAVSRKAKCVLIILASHRPELSDYLLGPNAAKVVRHSDCSVMVVRD